MCNWYTPDAPLEPRERPMCICPVCGQECNVYYMQLGEIVGCDACMEIVNAREYEEDINGDL